MSVRILNCDVMDGLKQIPDESMHCVVTSPPYWGLRDYGVDGQLGLEPTLGEHLDAMVGVFAEVHRVLRKDGTLWLNYGDCYATAPNGRSAFDTKALGKDDRTFRDKPFSTVGAIYAPDGGAKGGGDRRGKSGNKGNGGDGTAVPMGRVCAGGYLKPKDLCMVPNRLAIALQEAGWWVRSEIIWAKPNAMPESVKDRPASSHEKIWLLSKSAKYYYDHETVRTTALGTTQHRNVDSVYQAPGQRSHTGLRSAGLTAKKDKQRGHSRRHDDFNDRWDQMSKSEQQKNGRSLRNVWEIATRPFPDAHFATFPPELAACCIKAGCPIGGTVLDPFGGSGTTGLVADRIERNAVLIEINHEYAVMAERRISGDAPLFTNASILDDDVEQVAIL